MQAVLINLPWNDRALIVVIIMLAEMRTTPAVDSCTVQNTTTSVLSLSSVTLLYVSTNGVKASIMTSQAPFLPLSPQMQLK